MLEYRIPEWPCCVSYDDGHVWECTDAHPLTQAFKGEPTHSDMDIETSRHAGIHIGKARHQPASETATHPPLIHHAQQNKHKINTHTRIHANPTVLPCHGIDADLRTECQWLSHTSVIPPPRDRSQGKIDVATRRSTHEANEYWPSVARRRPSSHPPSILSSPSTRAHPRSPSLARAHPRPIHRQSNSIHRSTSLRWRRDGPSGIRQSGYIGFACDAHRSPRTPLRIVFPLMLLVLLVICPSIVFICSDALDPQICRRTGTPPRTPPPRYMQVVRVVAALQRYWMTCPKSNGRMGVDVTRHGRDFSASLFCAGGRCTLGTVDAPWSPKFADAGLKRGTLRETAVPPRSMRPPAILPCQRGTPHVPRRPWLTSTTCRSLRSRVGLEHSAGVQSKGWMYLPTRIAAARYLLPH